MASKPNRKEADWSFALLLQFVILFIIEPLKTRSLSARTVSSIGKPHLTLTFLKIWYPFSASH